MHHEPTSPRSLPARLRSVVALLLLVIGGAGLLPAVEGDDVARVEAAVVVERQRRTAPAPQRRVRHEPPAARRRPRARVLVALAARSRPLVVVRDATRRGPPRTPCVVALT